jgi:hypothetical protein
VTHFRDAHRAGAPRAFDAGAQRWRRANGRAYISGMMETVSIARRYRGPPESGNGGYVCGLVAKALGGPAEVTLKSPPPLGTPLALVRDEAGVRLMHGDQEIAIARSAIVDVAAPAPPSPAEAREASGRYAGSPIPECYVCGHERTEGDGLRLFTGPDRSGAFVAAPWSPQAEHADDAGRVAAEYIWAALDCPGYFGLMRPALAALLGRLKAEIIEAPCIGEECIAVGWPLGSEGRKYFAGSALFAASGRLLAKAHAVWIELRA